MSAASKLNRHLRGWRRGQPKPKPVIRTERGPSKPRFLATPKTGYTKADPRMGFPWE